MTHATDAQQTDPPPVADPKQVSGSDDHEPDLYHTLKERYLSLVEATLAGTIYEDDPLGACGTEKYDPQLREYGWDWPSKAFTMIGLRRLRNLRAVVESVIGTNVPGDIMETGTWRGGAGIMARAVLAAYGIHDRRVILADSFAGLPQPNPVSYPADASSAYHEYPELAVPLDEVKRNFVKFGLLDEQVIFLPGWFKDTLPTAPVEQLAVLRLDGDMYESTIQALENLYDKVSVNGWIVIDDYGIVAACRTAVSDFLDSRDLRPEIYPIDGVGVFFRKTESRGHDAGRAAFPTFQRLHGERTAEALSWASASANIDAVAWREALMSVVRASEAVASANQSTKEAQAATDEAHEDARVLKEALAGARRQIAELSEAQSRAATLQSELGAILASRSWRLTRGYRAFGRALQQLRNRSRRSTPALSDPAVSPLYSDQAVRSGSADAYANLWANWPVWIDDNSFRTRRFEFVTSLDKGEVRTDNDTVILLKDRNFVDVIYRNLLLELRPQRIFEIGFYQGGMPLFLADMVAPEKVVGIDYTVPSEELRSLIQRAGLTDSVKLHGDILQNDTALIGQLLNGEFGDQPLDLIVDDASHEYEDTKACFEAFFGYLRPGGKYIIEDWGWLHWPGAQWQTAESHFWNKPAMTNLIFELVMTLGSHHPKIIARLEVLTWACVVVTRGEGLAHGERINLSATRFTSGRQFQPL